jgi:hypothetical protein
MANSRRITPQKSHARPGANVGFWQAEVMKVTTSASDPHKVFIKSDRMGIGVNDPVPASYIGSPPRVGDVLWATFVENRHDDYLIFNTQHQVSDDITDGVVRFGGQIEQHGVTLKIDPTEYSGSNRASMQMHKTIMGTDASVDGTEGDWYLYDNADNAWRIVVDTSGNVGIGTNSPDGLFHISAGESGDAEVIIEADTDNAGSEDDNPRLVFRQDGGLDMSAILQGNNFLTIANSDTVGGIIFSTGTSTGYANATERMRIEPGGYVGIGINNPTEKLHVVGNALITGNLTVNGSTTEINSTTLTVDDKNIELASTASPSDAAADGGGITLKGTTDKTILWENDTDTWDFNQGIRVGGYTTLTRTPSGEMSIFGHNVHVDMAESNKVLSTNSGYYGQMIKMYYSEGITFHAVNATVTAGNAFFTQGGTTNELMRIANDGKVGIGTTSPRAGLTVKLNTGTDGTPPSGTWAGEVYHASNASTKHGLLVMNNWMAAASTIFEAGSMNADNGAYASRFKIDGIGNVGIGTATPAESLDSTGALRAQRGGADGGMVMGQAYSSSYVGLHTNGMGNSGNAEYVLLSDGTHTFLSSGENGDTYIRAGDNSTTHQLKIGSAAAEFSGYVQTGSNLRVISYNGEGWSEGIRVVVAAGSWGGIRLKRTNNTSAEIGNWYMGYQNNSTHDFAFGCYNTGQLDNILYLKNSNGYVGIGTGSPAYKFDVASGDGAVRIGPNSYSRDLLLGGWGTGTGEAWVRASNGNLHLDNKSGYHTYLNHYQAGNVFMVAGASQGSVGIGNASPAYKLDVTGTGRFTGQITGNLTGNVTGNADTATTAGSATNATNATYIGVAANSANATRYPIFATGTSGNLQPLADAELTYNPSTNTLTTTAVRSTGGGDGGMIMRSWTGNGTYASLATNGMDLAQYVLLSNGNDTFLGSGNNSATHIRGPANSAVAQLKVTASTSEFTGPLSVSGAITASAGIVSPGHIQINRGDPVLYMQDTDHRSGGIHVNSNIFYVLRMAGNNSTTLQTTGGYWPLEISLENNDAKFGGSITAPGRVGIGTLSPASRLHIESDDATLGLGLFEIRNSNTSFAGNCQNLWSRAAPSSSWNLIQGQSGYNSTFGVPTDTEFRVTGAGYAYADGGWNGVAADYAEYFEWEDGNPTDEDRRGITVTLVGNKVGAAAEGEDIIGVVSADPVVVGDAAWDRWHGKYLRDEYGAYVREDVPMVWWVEQQESATEGTIEGYEMEGQQEVNHSYRVDAIPDDVTAPEDATYETSKERVLNPDWDESATYVPREDRPEWSPIGMLGKLRIRKGQPTGASWIKMRDISDTVEEWLVR